MKRPLLTLALALLCVPCVAKPPVAKKTAPVEIPAIRCVLEKVDDGDTIVVRVNGLRISVRLAGIDAPEISHAPSMAYRRGIDEQPFGEAARSALIALIGQKGDAVTVYPASDRPDQYGRVLGVVKQKQRNLNLLMVQEGFAWWYADYDPRNKKMKAAQEYAKGHKLGLWSLPSEGAPIAPWEWRKAAKAKT